MYIVVSNLVFLWVLSVCLSLWCFLCFSTVFFFFKFWFLCFFICLIVFEKRKKEATELDGWHCEKDLGGDGGEKPLSIRIYCMNFQLKKKELVLMRLSLGSVCLELCWSLSRCSGYPDGIVFAIVSYFNESLKQPSI